MSLTKTIEEIDNTPLRWKAGGILWVLASLIPTFVELPVPLIPTGILAPVATPPEFWAAFMLASPLWIALGIYGGYVFHQLHPVDQKSPKEDTGEGP